MRKIPFKKTLHGKIAVTIHALGPFEVSLNPMDAYNKVAALGRMSIDKQFHGGLEATSKGEMLTAMTPVEGSAGYVAIEQVSGTLHGRRGTFVLQHNGIMNRGALQLKINVVPDSGTDELKGIMGMMMMIKIDDEKHSYDFEYSLNP